MCLRGCECCGGTQQSSHSLWAPAPAVFVWEQLSLLVQALGCREEVGRWSGWKGAQGCSRTGVVSLVLLWTGQGWRGCRSSEGCPAPGGHQLSPRHFCLMSPSPPQTPPRQGCHNLPGDLFRCFPVCRVRKVSLCLTQTSFVQLKPKSSCPLRTGEWGGCTRRGCNPARLLCLFQIKRRGVWFLRQTPSNQ